MKKLSALLLSCCAMVFAVQAKTFDDKTNLDQLTFKTLDAGQIAWNEEEGSAVLYIGSPSETKNLRVVDPAALRGYRYKQITSELTFNASDNMTVITNGTFKYIHADGRPLSYDYNPILKETTVHTNSQGVVAEYYCRYDENTGTYIKVDLPHGYVIDPTRETLFIRIQYWPAIVTIFSKDSIIEDLDYVYTQQSGGFGDMDPITTSRSVTYDGRKAILTIKVLQTSGPGRWFQVTGFTARCKGIGDVEMVNDVSAESDLTVMIKDNVGTYNLANLRYELYHKYDGHRAEHWANYPATNNVRMGSRYLQFNIKTNLTSFIGGSGDAFTYSHGGMNYLKYTPPGDLGPSSPYYGLQCQITAITPPTASSTAWTIDFLTNKAVPINFINIEYKSDLLNAFWEPIEVAMTNPSSDLMTWHVVIPDYYGTVGKGFWRVKFNVNALDGNLDIKASVRMLGSDGKMYKLSFPVGGGAVTATLDQ